MVKEDLKRWQDFQQNGYPFEKLKRKDEERYVKLICELHARYFNHKYKEPCTCNGSIYRRWVEEINNLITKDYIKKQ
tara:strand:- start:1337 stop:1567 length:231 start_codon:yes stop_codon:yes gene_type:complete